MALKDLFKMTKADRYTADGCEELNKAREAATEDARRTYKNGEISENTGLMKTPNGWVEPPNGKAKGTKTDKPNPNGITAQQKQKLEAEKREAARRDAQAPSKKTEVNTPGLRKDVQEAIKRSSPEEIKAYIKELRTPGSRMSRYFDNPDLLANVYEDELKKATESKPAASVTEWEESAKKDAKAYNENMVILQNEKGETTAVRESSPDVEKAEAHGYKKMSLVRPDGSVKKHQGNNSESKPDAADQRDQIGGEIKGNLEAAKYYFDKAQSFSPTDPSYKTYMTKAKQYNDEAKAQADDNGFDFEEMHNAGITQAVNKYAEEQSKPDKVGDFLKAYERGDFGKYQQNAEQRKAESFFKQNKDAAPRVLTGDCKIRVKK